ncbi:MULTISPECIES: hypothetical protein [Pantoea]|uniref:hypothetical protein n=1 Tax=Pantoea TaxID=53335 RepID=UPI001CF7B4AC|nr:MULTISPECIES: hypothetical protein [Pantoea]
MNNEVFINDIQNSIKYTIHDIPSRIFSSSEDLKYGPGEYLEKFNDGWLEDSDSKVRFKITEYHCDYDYREPIASTSIIDFSEQIKAIVEDFQSGKKKLVMNDGSVK